MTTNDPYSTFAQRFNLADYSDILDPNSADYKDWQIVRGPARKAYEEQLLSGWSGKGPTQFSLSASVNPKYEKFKLGVQDQLKSFDDSYGAMSGQIADYRAEKARIDAMPSEAPGAWQGVSNAMTPQQERERAQFNAKYAGEPPVGWNDGAGVLGMGTGFNGAGNKDWNDYNISRLLKGEDISYEDFGKGAHNLSDVTGNNTATKFLRKQWDPLYQTKASRTLNQNLGTQLGLTQEEVNKVAGLVSASSYQDRFAQNKSPFAIGKGGKTLDNVGTDQYTTALMDYAETKYGNQLPEEYRGAINDQAFGIDKQLRKLNKAPRSKSGGLFHAIFSGLDPILDKIDPLHDKTQNLITDLIGADSQEQAFSTIAPAVVDFFVPGLGSGLSAANSLTVGDPGGAALSAIGSYLGATGTAPNITGSVPVDKALTQAGLSGLKTGIGGGDWSDILKAAGLAGASSYGSSAMGDTLKTNEVGALGRAAANTGYSALTGGIRSEVLGGDFGKGAVYGALGGVSGAVSNYASRIANNFLKAEYPELANNPEVVKQITNFITSQLVKKARNP